MPRPNRTLLFAALAALAPACGGGGGGGPAELSGHVELLVESVAPLLESEGNDHLDSATSLGALSSGPGLRVLAGFEEPWDALDGFHALARAPLALEIEALPVHGSDLVIELAAFDALEQRFAARSPSANAAQRARLELRAHGAFDLVVRRVSGSGSYLLRVSASPVASASGAGPARELVALGASASSAASIDANAFESYAEPALEARRGELLVLPRDASQLEAIAADHGLELRARIPEAEALLSFALAPQLDARAAAREAVARARRLEEDPRVARAELNLVRHPSSLGSAPNDLHYSKQWHYPLIHLPEAWGLTTGSNTLIAAVLDTGETQHPDLVARQIAGYDFISDAIVAGDGNGQDPDPTDEGDGDGAHPATWHGTHVAGTLGASTNNGIGVAGVTWSGGLMHLRVLGVGGGSDFDIANAVRYAAGLANSSSTLPTQAADVINMSLGGAGSSSTLQNAISAAKTAGVVLFAAAGNEGSSQPSYPAAYNGVISVAAVDYVAQRASYSNTGATLDVAAPGGDMGVDLNADGFPDGVLSTWIDDTGPNPSPVYAFSSGTSMACPHAAGVAMLMLSMDSGLTPDQLETLMESSATDLGAPGFDTSYGNGLIDAQAAVLAASGAASGSPVLSLTPTAIAFGSAQTALSAQVKNIGSGLLDVGALSVSTVDGASWLTATPIASASASTDTSSIALSVDRSGLSAGAYQGSVSVASNGGTVLLSISMEVADVIVLPSLPIHVLLVDAQTFALVDMVDVDPAELNPPPGAAGAGALALVDVVLPFAFHDVPAGSYVLAASTDDDNDLVYCESSESYCGYYPSSDAPIALDVGEGETITNLDFALIGGSGTPGASSAQQTSGAARPIFGAALGRAR